ncbi:MAG: hypothetical protein ACI9SQ_001145 [Rubritalea sp.]|jgi:hypothetical protein
MCGVKIMLEKIESVCDAAVKHEAEDVFLRVTTPCLPLSKKVHRDTPQKANS